MSVISLLADLDFNDEEFSQEYAPNLPAYEHPETMTVITPINPHDPSLLGYPPTLLVELALRSSPLNEILDGYHIDAEQWDVIRNDPAFMADLARTMEQLKEEGAGFKMKAKLQAESLLQTSWQLIHDRMTPPAVKADLIKSTVKWSGYEPKLGVNESGAPGSGFSISINFNGGSQNPRLVNGG